MAEELVEVRVKPRATRVGVEVTPEGGVIVRVHAPAVEGAANRELIETFAEAVGVPRSAVRIARGERGRAKQLAVEGLTASEVLERLRGRQGIGNGPNAK